MTLAPSNREPKQARSRESFERVLAAATRLLEQGGYEGLTLQDVSHASGVSIGSIYGRVSSKDELIRVVQRRALDALEREQAALLDPIRWRDLSLDRLAPALVNELAEFLRRHAPLLRAFMSRADADPLVGAAGRASAERSAERVQRVLLLRRAEITHSDPEHAAAAAYTAIYAIFGRLLGLGVSLEASGGGDWAQSKEDVALMCLSFLKSGVDRR